MMRNTTLLTIWLLLLWAFPGPVLAAPERPPRPTQGPAPGRIEALQGTPDEPGHPQAQAMPRRDVAVLKLPILGTTKEVEALFRAAVQQALRDAKLSVVPDAEVDAKVARDPQLLMCQTRTCFARVGVGLGVGAVIEGQIARPQRSTYTAQMQVRDLSSGKFIGAPVEERCEICGTEEARQMVQRAAQRVAQQVPRGVGVQAAPTTGVLDLAADPRGATIVLDGEVQADRAPATFLLGIGVHSVELRAPGYRAGRRPVEIPPGGRVQLNIELPVIRPRRPWLTALSVVTVTGAVGLGGAAIGLGAFHDRPRYSEVLYDEPCVSPAAHCPQKYNTAPYAIGLGVAAGVLAVGGVISLVLEYRSPPRRPLPGF
jgi:hypothetical protein